MPTEELFGLNDLEFLHNESRTTSDGRRSNLFHFRYNGEVQDVCPDCGSKLYKHGTRHLVVTDTPFGGVQQIWILNILESDVGTAHIYGNLRLIS